MMDSGRHTKDCDLRPKGLRPVVLTGRAKVTQESALCSGTLGPSPQHLQPFGLLVLRTLVWTQSIQMLSRGHWVWETKALMLNLWAL